MLKFCFYVPASHLETVKDAVFQAGAGRIGNYEYCCWQVEGQGQFKPLLGAKPAIGHIDTLEKVSEYRVEMVCDESCIHAVMSAFRLAHPYEEPAYDVMATLEFLEPKS